MTPRFAFALSLLFPGPLAAQPTVDFQRDIRPLFQKHCLSCHGPDKQRADLRLDQKAEAFKGGDSGPVLLPGKSAGSILWQRVTSTDKTLRMPPSGPPLSAEQLRLLKTWIDQGAAWPEEAVSDPKKEHWSFQPLARPPVPAVKDKTGKDKTGKDRTWARNPIDAFILERLQKEKLTPAPETDRRTLLRRLKFDLLGLPPTPEEVDAFLKDARPDAYEQWVETYLASPHFGERWARHWLDVVRFAESSGFETNQPRLNAWPYRDYVIRAFNEDKPFDRFVLEHLAGDAFGEDAATGFLVGGAADLVKSPDVALTLQQRADELHDMVSTTATAFLGLTVGCARCHNHKFDPVSHLDYHAMKAMFAGVQHGERPLRILDEPDRKARVAELTKKINALAGKLARLEPFAHPHPTLFLDDDRPKMGGPETPSVTQIVPRLGMQPHQPGTAPGQMQDPGSPERLPNLGKGYSYWNKVPDRDVFTWNPRARGRYRVWLSWGCGWKTHAADARYVLDRDGDLNTKDDQTEIARVDQRKFADGTGTMPGQPLWSGFFNAGAWDLNDNSRIVLRGGKGDEYVTADVLLLQEEPAETEPAPFPRLRSPVHRFANVERFPPIPAKFLRMTIRETTDLEPCLDELEVFTAGPDPTNIALASRGTKTSSSGNYPGNPIHRLEHLNDGRYGNSWSWISNEFGKGWVTLEFPEVAVIDRVLWSRDREVPGKYSDRTATKYVIEVAVEPGKWQVVASSQDRLPRGNKPVLLVAASPEERPQAAQLVREKQELEAELKKISASPLVYAGRFTAPEPTYRLHRGDPMQKRELVAPAALTSLGPKLSLAMDVPEQQRRLALARWITHKDNPLTARVAANRLWHYHFGTGLVATPSDFGLMGARPSHPELLDWLAAELMTPSTFSPASRKRGDPWSLKHLHRLIVTSATYRQSSAPHPDGLAKDAQTRLLWRYPPRRLEAEPLRDAILLVSGKLNLKTGGPGFDLFEPNTNYVKVYAPRKDFGPEEWRRMIYQSKWRMQVDDTFGAFDCPDGGQITPKRHSSITALQALNLLNSPFLIQQAAFLAQRLEKEPTLEAQAHQGFRFAFARAPAKEELVASIDLIRDHGLVVFARALYNTNEFLFID